MNNAIVITSIYPPTEAILKFSVKEEYKMYVVGDEKTPVNWDCQNVNFISLDQQKNNAFSLARILPYNHYCRKMLGYLEAVKNKADTIYDTDDDNIPYDNWGFPDFYGKYDFVEENKGFINIYQLFTKEKVWPRGLPLRLINTDFELHKSYSKELVKIGIWQGLADEDPDVDAIYRLTDGKSIFFQKRAPIVLGKDTVSPFNTQNTLIRKELFPLLYLPSYVTFRYTDILRGLIAQPIMWLEGFHLGFTEATVVQKRNPHNYMNDFISEVPMYETCEKIIEIVLNSITQNESIENNLFNAYIELLKFNIVEPNELITLDAWLNDLKKLY